MADTLDIHPASQSERAAAHRNVHDIWSYGSDIDEHVKCLLTSVRHNRAEWFVGLLAGRVVTSLGCYPFEFRLRGEVVSGIGIAAVHTLAEFRGRGFASQLIQWVEEYRQARGAAISLLYSDVDPLYYARLGYAQCPSWEGWFDVGDVVDSTDRNSLSLIPFSPTQERISVQKIYADYHSRLEISIERNDAYWDFLFGKETSDEFHWLQSLTGDKLGFLRLRLDDDDITIRDLAFVDHSPMTVNLALAALVRFVHDKGAQRVGGWLPETSVHSSHFVLQARQLEITMLKSLQPQVVLDQDVLSSAQYFHEIDHV